MKYKVFYIALLALALTGCKKDHAHDEEEIKLQFTAYSRDFEVFAEADPFSVGATSGILSHFSQLPDFTALEKGRVTLRLIVNGKETSQTLESPTRKGIYKFEITPHVAGQGKIVYEFLIDNRNYLLEVPDITVYATANEAVEAAGSITVPQTNATSFTKEQSWKIDFATAHPSVEPFGQVIKTTAQVLSAPGDESIVAAKASGTVIFSSANALEGKSVSHGQTLFTITGAGLAGSNPAVQFAEAKNNFEKASADYERAKELSKDKIVSEKELLSIKNQYDNARVQFDNMKNNFSSTGQTIKSPMNGFVKQIFIRNGQNVEAGQAIVSVSQNKILLLRAEVQQKYASVLPDIRTAVVRTPGDNKTYTFEELNGKILSYGRNVNADSYLLPINLQVDNKGSLVPGRFVEVYLKSISNEQSLTVPNGALIEEQGIYYIFVQIHPELFEKREVKTGATDGQKTEIIAGIAATDRIVIKGAMMIKLAQSTGTLDAHSGHVH